MNKLLALALLLTLSLPAFSQEAPLVDTDTRINWQLYIAPTLLISSGVIMRAVPDSSPFSKENIQHDFAPKDGKRENKADDYLQFLPLAGAVGLPLLFPDVEHRSSYGRMMSKTAISQVLTFGTIHIMKGFFGDARPNGNSNSFPSGHTAQAFFASQILYLEYRDTNKWLAYAGYPVAAFVGAERVMNNDHWVCDVLVGAGIGMLVPTLVYWIDDKFFEHHSSDAKIASNFFLTPTYLATGKEDIYGIKASFMF